MMRAQSQSNPFWQLLISLVFGAVIGLLTFAFINGLASLNAAQANLNLLEPFHLLLAPLVFLLIYLVRRRSLFFPYKISEMSAETSSSHWSVIMAPAHFFGTLLGHASGMSLGREAAVVLFSSGLVRLFRLAWNFWGPIAASIGFACVLGQAWLAPIFMFELFGFTSFLQKTLSLIGAMVAVLVTRSFGIHALFAEIEFQDGSGFFKKLFVLFLFGVSVGFLMRYYKKLHHVLVQFFSKSNLLIRILVVVLLMTFLYLPQFRVYQSLGLSEFHDLSQLSASYETGLVKLILTMITTSLGFLGGEFIPLVFSGCFIGGAFFQTFGLSPLLGAGFGAYILFAAATRLKWTSFFLMLALLGWGWWLWVIYVLSIATSFSGDESLYRKPQIDTL